MTISRRLQYRLLAEHGQTFDTGFQKIDRIPVEGARVVYQGVEGAYSHEASMAYFGEDADAFHVRTWEEAMRAVEDGRADYGVLPIENSSAGAVSDNYDLLIKYHNCIVAEIFLPVKHALLGVPGGSLEQIHTVFSHPQALMQCSEYLNSHGEWSQISVENTAVAAKKVLEEGDPSQAAVASEAAAKLYGLQILKSGINYNKDNVTRFIVVSRNRVYQKDAAKVSLCFELPHRSGTLYNMLSNFIYNNVNMRMIQSRPIPGRNWEYRFFVDIEGRLDEPAVANALKGRFRGGGQFEDPGKLLIQAEGGAVRKAMGIWIRRLRQWPEEYLQRLTSVPLSWNWEFMKSRQGAGSARWIMCAMLSPWAAIHTAQG